MPTTSDEQQRALRARTWWRDLWRIWGDAHLLADDELLWLAQITGATFDNKPPTHDVRGRPVVIRHPDTEDVSRLEQLDNALAARKSEAAWQLRQHRRRQLTERLTRLGLHPESYGVLTTTGLDQRAAP